MTFTGLTPAASDPPEPFTDRLRLAVAAYLARFKGSSRAHTESDLRCYLAWCAERGLDPLAAQRRHLELYIRWMQEIRRFKPSTVSRRFSVVAGFTGPALSMASSSTRPPSTCEGGDLAPPQPAVGRDVGHQLVPLPVPPGGQRLPEPLHVVGGRDLARIDPQSRFPGHAHPRRRQRAACGLPVHVRQARVGQVPVLDARGPTPGSTTGRRPPGRL
jgi:hypothetical protein